MLFLSGAAFNFLGGTITGESPLLLNSTLNFGTSLAAASFVMTGAGGRVNGTIAAGQSLWVKGQNLGGHTTVTALNGLTNNGTIRLESADGGYESRITIAAGALTNRGTITTGVGSGGNRTIVGNVINQGTIGIALTGSFSGTLTSTGTIDVGDGQALTLGSGDILNLKLR